MFHHETWRHPHGRPVSVTAYLVQSSRRDAKDLRRSVVAAHWLPVLVFLDEKAVLLDRVAKESLRQLPLFLDSAIGCPVVRFLGHVLGLRQNARSRKHEKRKQPCGRMVDGLCCCPITKSFRLCSQPNHRIPRSAYHLPRTLPGSKVLARK